MQINIPDWYERESITIKLSELTPDATTALIECLAEQSPNDPRVAMLKMLWDHLAD